jgi:hypothetical protein
MEVIMFLVQVALIKQSEQGGIERMNERKIFSGGATLDQIKEWIIEKAQNPNIILKDVLLSEPEIEDNLIKVN